MFGVLSQEEFEASFPGGAATVKRAATTVDTLEAKHAGSRTQEEQEEPDGKEQEEEWLERFAADLLTASQCS